MTKQESEVSFKHLGIPTSVFRRFPKIRDIQNDLDDLVAALVTTNVSNWTPLDEKFQQLIQTMHRLRTEVFQIIDEVEPLVFVDGRPDGVPSRLLRYMGYLLGRLNQIADDMSIPAQNDMIRDIIGVDIASTLTQLNERSVAIQSTLESLNADEGPTEIVHTLQSIFRDTFDWLDGLLIMYSSQLAKMRENLYFFEQQLSDEVTPEEKRDLVTGVELAKTKIREYEKALALVEEFYQSLRIEERRFKRKYQGPSQQSDDEYPDLDDEWG